MIDGTFVAARAVHFAATLLLQGCIVFQFFVARDALGGDRRDAAFRAIGCVAAGAWIVAAISAVAWFLSLAAELEGASALDALSDGTAWTLLTQTQFGWDWLARAAGFVLLALLFFSLRPQPQGPFVPAEAGIQFLNSIEGRTGSRLSRGRTEEIWPPAVLIALSMALTGSLAWSGHGAATPGARGDLHLAADILHLVAAGIWLGGLVPYAMLLAMRPGAAAEATARFSWLATIGVLVLLPTGIVNGWAILPGLAALTGTLYGKLLLAKIGLFLLMLAFAGVNRFVLTPRLASAKSSDARTRLIIHSGCEIALGLAILALVGVLGTLAPAGEHRHDMAQVERSQV